MKNFTKVMMAGMFVGGFAMTANAQVNVVETIDLQVKQTVVEGYESTSYSIDAAAIAEKLECTSLEAEGVSVVSLDEEMQVLAQSGNNGYWYNADGEVCMYGPDAVWFIEYHPDEDPNVLYVGNMPGLTSAEGECNIGFAYNDNVVLYNVSVVLEAVDYGEVSIVKEYDLIFSNKPSSVDYETAELPFDAEAAKAELGVEALTSDMLVSLDEDGNIVSPNANGIGYWYGYNGSVTPWGNDAAWWIEVNDPEDATSFLVGNYPECEEAEGECNLGFLSDGKIVLFNVMVTINPDAEYEAGAGVESLVSDENAPLKVYNLQGVPQNVKDLKSLKGIYIVNGKKVVLK